MVPLTAPAPSPLIPSLIFGAITCVTGLLGVVIGAATTRLCRQKTERADPLVCAVSMLGSAIFICLIFVVAKKSIVGAYVRASWVSGFVAVLHLWSQPLANENGRGGMTLGPRDVFYRQGWPVRFPQVEGPDPGQTAEGVVLLL